MIAIVLAACLGASAAIFCGGYALGARRGAKARALLRDDLGQRDASLAALRDDLYERDTSLAALRDDLRERDASLAVLRDDVRDIDALRSDLRDRDATCAALHDDLRSRDATCAALREELVSQRASATRADAALRAELRDARATIAANERAAAHLAATSTATDGVRRAVDAALAPLLAERALVTSLANLPAARGRLRDLPTLLDTIADRARLGDVVLSDAHGLPLAASRGADADHLAATAAYLGALASRTALEGAPRPVACALHDDHGASTVHRFFAVGDDRFTLSAIGKDRPLGALALDAALVPLERLLARG